MKKIKSFAILGLIFAFGCESMNNNEVNLDDPELQAFADGLNADIGLSKSSNDALKDALNRHGKDGMHRRDPGFLWKVAAEMQKNLSGDEKDKMFAWMNDNSIAFLHSPDKKDYHGPKGDKDGMDMRLMMEVLDADQQQALKDIMTSYRSQMEQVMRAMKDGTKDEATVKAEIEALERAMKNEIDSLLTDEQRDKIETMQSEIKQKMEDIRLAERDAMISALNMSSDQVTLLESINKKYEEAIKSLFDDMKNAGDDADRSSLEEKIKEINLTRNDEFEQLFSDDQLEVIKVHASLVMMFSKHCDGRKDGRWSDKGGRDDSKKDCIDRSRISDGACPMVYDPVCGCDKVTYSNGCMASNAGLTSTTPGVCR